ncbi:hypothetical protein [Leuconostoc fallax]|uniref:hypothetical protein n=1 Tax=Leuconostoc fallax TaxID=1251 RepID=UPI001C1F0E3D|nr:hypothetical protein [Leuconostoc fallax]MBU7455670.1 hypothetical protein [Leuconostoc fallax]
MSNLISVISDDENNIIYPETVADAIIDGDKLVHKEEFSILKEDFEKVSSQSNENSSLLATINEQNTPWSPWSKDGMFLLNGAQTYSGDYDYPQFRTRKVNGNLQVQIQCRLKNLTAGGDTPYIGFPSNLQPNSTTQIGQSSPTTNGRTASWTVDKGVIRLHSNSDNNFDAGYWYPLLMTWEVN